MISAQSRYMCPPVSRSSAMRTQPPHARLVTRGPSPLHSKMSVARPSICRAEPEEKPEEPSPKKPKPASSKEDVVLEELKKTGMTAENAKTLLKTWADVGVEDPKQLRKLLVNRSIKPLTGLTFQTLIDVVAAAGGLYIVDLLPKEDPIFGSIFIEALGYFFFIYYSIQVLLDVSVAGAVIYSTYRYGTSSTELLSAVKKLAQPKSMGLSVVDKAQVAVNTLKVLQTMETVATMLQEQYAMAESTKPSDSLRNLSSYLTLANARSTLGFDPATYGLTEKEAGNIAYAFSVYDTNDNGKLELNELSALCEDLGDGCPLDSDEIKVAYKKLDVNKSGFIEFNDFVDWWVKKTPKSATASQDE